MNPRIPLLDCGAQMGRGGGRWGVGGGEARGPSWKFPVFRIRNRKFMGLPDPDHTLVTSQRYGSGSSHYQAKIVRKPLISTVL
jgi:hypothetical protein